MIKAQVFLVLWLDSKKCKPIIKRNLRIWSLKLGSFEMNKLNRQHLNVDLLFFLQFRVKNPCSIESTIYFRPFSIKLRFYLLSLWVPSKLPPLFGPFYTHFQSLLFKLVYVLKFLLKTFWNLEYQFLNERVMDDCGILPIFNYKWNSFVSCQERFVNLDDFDWRKKMEILYLLL